MEVYSGVNYSNASALIGGFNLLHGNIICNVRGRKEAKAAKQDFLGRTIIDLRFSKR